MKNQHKHLHLARRKMSRIVDEIYTALLHYGSSEVNLNITREENGLRLIVKSDFDPDCASYIEKMGKLLTPDVRSPAMVEMYWELAGEDRYTSDSEIALVGQMVDEAKLSADSGRVEISLFVAY